MQDNVTVLFLGIGMAVLAGLLMICLSNLSRMRQNQRQTEDTMLEALSSIQSSIYANQQQQRDDISRSLQQTNDSLLNTITSLNAQETVQMNEFFRQMRENNQFQEIRMDRMSHTVESRIAEMRQVMDEKLDKKLDESLAQMSTRLEKVYKELGEMQSLTRGVSDLKKVLSNVKTRGIWGEMQLGSLLAEVLDEKQYVQNAVMKPGSTQRVEFAVCLPGREGQDGQPVYLPIDSKFPQEDYLRLTAASEQGDTDGVAEARKMLEARVKSEAKDISEKYVAAPYTTDFGILFLPTEGLYAEVVQIPGLMETLQRDYRVVAAGPSTLAGLLNSLQMGFRTLAIEQRSQEVWRLLGAIKTDFGMFAQTLSKTQDKLKQASDSIDSAYVRTRSIERKLKQVEAIDTRKAGQLLGDDEHEEGTI